MSSWIHYYLVVSVVLTIMTLLTGWTVMDDPDGVTGRSMARYTLFLPITAPLTPLFWCAGLGWVLVLLVRFLWRTAFPPPPPDTTRKPDGGPYRGGPCDRKGRL